MSYVDTADLAATGSGQGAEMVGFIQPFTGALAQTVSDKVRETVSVLDFGAVGDGTTDDTAAFSAAIASGKDVFVPGGGYVFAVVGGITGFADYQRIYGGGTLKALSTASHPIFLLQDGSEGVWVDGVEFDGASNLLAAAPVSGIFGRLVRSLTVTHCRFHHLPDCGIKLWDGANLYAAANHFHDIRENGIELRNYASDPYFPHDLNHPEAWVSYAHPRPPVEGNHTIIGNCFERITREEHDGGETVDACAITFGAGTGYPPVNIRVIGNYVADCLRGIWTESYTLPEDPNKLALDIVIANNVVIGGVSGGTADGIYCKAGIGIVAGRNAVITGNTVRNVGNHRPKNTNVACIVISGSTPESISSNVEIASNILNDDTGVPGRTAWGVHCLAGEDIRIHDNAIHGFADGPIYLQPSLVTQAACTANSGAEDAESWRQPVAFVFAQSSLQASASNLTHPSNIAFDDDLVLPAGGRIVGVSAKLTALVSAGDLTVKTFGDGVEEVALRIDTAGLSGGFAVKQQAAEAAAQLQPGARLRVLAVADSSFAPVGAGIIVTVLVDFGLKR